MSSNLSLTEFNKLLSKVTYCYFYVPTSYNVKSASMFGEKVDGIEFDIIDYYMPSPKNTFDSLNVFDRKMPLVVKIMSKRGVLGEEINMVEAWRISFEENSVTISLYKESKFSEYDLENIKLQSILEII